MCIVKSLEGLSWWDQLYKRIQHSMHFWIAILDFKKLKKMGPHDVIIATSQDILKILAGHCMESHNQGPRTATRATRSSETSKHFNMRQWMHYQLKHQVLHQPWTTSILQKNNLFSCIRLWQNLSSHSSTCAFAQSGTFKTAPMLQLTIVENIDSNFMVYYRRPAIVENVDSDSRRPMLLTQ